MSNIASLLTSGPTASVQGNRGKASPNSQGDGEGFAKQLSENKTAKGAPSQNSRTDITETKENDVDADLDVSIKSSHSPDMMKLNYEFNPEAYPASIDLELNINELELSSDLDVPVLPVEVLPKEIAVPFEDFPNNIEPSVSAVDVETPLTAQEILAALNTQLGGKALVTENVQKIKSQLNSVNTETVTADLNSTRIELDPALKSKSADIINLNKVVISPDADRVSLPAQNTDASKTNNNQNFDTMKASTNNTILASLANGEGLSDSGADPQGGGSNQFANQVDKTGVKLDGVNVLEARVFPAISPSNSTNIVDALLKTSQVSNNTGLLNSDPIYNTAQPKAMNTLKIQLVPANLGTVTAVMKLTGEELQVELQVDNIEAYRKLSSDSASIVNTLKNQGFGIEQVNVQLMNGDRGSAQQGQQQNGQLFQDQNQRETSSSFGRDRDGSSSPNSNELNQELGNNESEALQASQVTDLSNGVYL